ncbi:MAG: LPS export ABC transporter periplasmic protein LptC [Methylophilaceae bacterium]
MYGRPTILFPLALLALLALLTLWIDHTVQAPEQKPAGSTRHDPDYFLKNFVLSKTDVNGNLQYMLAAISMTHYPDDDSTTLERPRFTQYGVGKPYTQIEGQRGLISSNGETVEFMDNVKVVRQATAEKGEMTMLTQSLKIYPQKELATTDQPVVIRQAPKTVIHATGMIFDKKQKTVTLLKKVRVHYENPNPPKAAAKSKGTGNKAVDKKPAGNADKKAVKRSSVNR